jgi:POT family proton-dependent oligopeptide transporter
VTAARRTFFGQPIGLATLFFTELWERLSYYGMRALLVLFLVDSTHGGFGLDDATAVAIYGLYTAAVYLLGLPGGVLADRLLGAQRAVLWGGVFIALGHVLLGSAPSHALFYLGLAVIVLGTGLLKPNVSAMVAALYPEGGARRDAGFTTYYMGINIGATLGPLITGWLAERYGWRAGFLAAAVGMGLGVVQFAFGRRLLAGAGHEPAAAPRAAAPAPIGARVLGLTVAVPLLAASLWLAAVRPSAVQLQSLAVQASVALSVLYFAYLLWGAGLSARERRGVLVVAVLFLASVLFWSGYEQAGSSLNLFAERYTNLGLFGYHVPAAWLQSLDAVFVIAFAPAFAALWVQLGRRGLDPGAPVKFIFALLAVAMGFLVMAVAARLVVSGQTVGMGWLTLTYLLHTFGELCLSPVGMSAFTQLLPRRFLGQSMGIWFVSMSLGNLLASRFAGRIDPHHPASMPAEFLRVFWLGLACAAVVAMLLPWVRRWSTGAAGLARPASTP